MATARKNTEYCLERRWDVTITFSVDAQKLTGSRMGPPQNITIVFVNEKTNKRVTESNLLITFRAIVITCQDTYGLSANTKMYQIRISDEN